LHDVCFNFTMISTKTLFVVIKQTRSALCSI